jgi:hypothetical protein
MAAVLTNTSYPHRTSPVLRGGWLLERILGERVPPPPPNVPALEEGGNAGGPVAARAARAASYTCPNVRRATTASIRSGSAWSISTPSGAGGPTMPASRSTPRANCRRERSSTVRRNSSRILLARSDQFLKHLIRQMLGFALGRPLNRFDQCVIDDTFKALQREDYRAALLVEEIVVSYPFQHRFIKR